MKRRIIAVLVFLLAAGTISSLTSSCKKDTDGLIRTTGTVEATEVNLSFKLAGRVSAILFNEGDSVKAGQTVMSLEANDISAALKEAEAASERAEEDVKTAEAEVETARAEIKSAEAGVLSAEADVRLYEAEAEEAEKELGRFKELHKGGFASTSELDTKKTAYDSASAGLWAAKARLGSSAAKLEAAKAALKKALSRQSASAAALKEAKANLSYRQAVLDDTTVKSPISGTVAFKGAETGEVLSPGKTVLTVLDLSDLSVRTDIEETLIAGLALGGKARITAGGGAFEGVVSEIGSYAGFATQRDVLRGRNDIKTFRVKISVGDAGGALKPGMTVDVELPSSGGTAVRP